MDPVTKSDSDATNSLANRYGTPKRVLSKKSKIIITSVTGALALLWILWVVVGGITGISHKVLSYNVIDSTMTTVDLAVTKAPQDTARCAVKALNSSYAVVGWNVLTIGPNGTDVGSENGRTTTIRGEIRTDSLAVTGVVENCWIVK